MEYRLFFIGSMLGAYAWISRIWKTKGGPATPRKSAMWHGFFLFLSSFSATIVLSMSFEIRARLVSITAHAIPLGDSGLALALGALVGTIGYWSAFSAGDNLKLYRLFLHEDLNWADTICSAALTASLLMIFVVQAFKIPSASMEKTLLIGDHLFVSKFLYGARVPLSGRRILPLRTPQRGDIVVFQFPSEDPNALHCSSVQYGKDFIKRLIGVPGDTIEVRQGVVILNGKRVEARDEPYAVHDDPYREPQSPHAKEISPERYQELWQTHMLDMELQNNQRDFFGPVKVPEHAYFMMGDNRDHSCDSRFWGPVEERYVKGKAWFLYWPPSRMGAAR